QEISTPPVEGRYPASAWSAGEIVRDQHSFWLSEAFVAGIYELRVGLDEMEGWVSLGRIELSGR
ncbi:MAG: hypothetical protein JSV36_03235, partial [Anaerolineae bacterium]